MKIIISLAMAAAFTVLAVAPASALAQQDAHGNGLAWAETKNWQPCASDEPVPGHRCIWDARHMGNGTGRSFIVTKTGNVIVISHRDAHRLLRPLYAL